MTEKLPPPSLEDLEARLRQARQRESADGAPGNGQSPRFAGLGLAFRIGVELFAAIAVGAGIGFLADYWLGTKPWGLVVFLVLGWAAGVLNVYRAVKGMGSAVGYRDRFDDDGS